MVSTEIWLRIMSGMMINAVLFGIGAISVLSIPALSEQAKYLMPAVVVASFVGAPFLAGMVARRMRIRHWGRAGWKQGDFISG